MRRVRFEAGVCVLWALAVLLVPFRWLISALAAAVIHEACHILAVRMLGGNILDIQIGFHGAVIKTGPLTYAREGICALAGPAGSLMLALWGNRFPVLAFCGLVQGGFNLLPVYPMDGGRALLAFMKHLFPEHQHRKAEQWLRRISLSVIGSAGILCVLLTDFVILPVFTVISVAYRSAAGKKPCKRTRQALQ